MVSSRLRRGLAGCKACDEETSADDGLADALAAGAVRVAGLRLGLGLGLTAALPRTVPGWAESFIAAALASSAVVKSSPRAPGDSEARYEALSMRRVPPGEVGLEREGERPGADWRRAGETGA
jgi:hypothetical protein